MPRQLVLFIFVCPFSPPLVLGIELVVVELGKGVPSFNSEHAERADAAKLIRNISLGKPLYDCRLLMEFAVVKSDD